MGYLDLNKVRGMCADRQGAEGGVLDETGTTAQGELPALQTETRLEGPLP
jgi:hypothetical protein